MRPPCHSGAFLRRVASYFLCFHGALTPYSCRSIILEPSSLNQTLFLLTVYFNEECSLINGVYVHRMLISSELSSCGSLDDESKRIRVPFLLLSHVNYLCNAENDVDGYLYLFISEDKTVEI